MKKITILAITALMSFFGQAQNVGINTTGAVGDASAGLDVNFTDKGVLIPRVALSSRANNAPVTGP